MDMAFVKVLNMSISASWLVLAILLLRLILKKSPKWISVALWALVAVRLICPFSVESMLSLLPSAETIPETIVYAQTPAIDSGVTVIDKAVNSSLTQHRTPEVGASVNPVQIDLFIGEMIWCLGMAVMLTWAIISYFRLKRKVDASVGVGNGVYICDYINTPFILGIVKPKIYLPSAMEPDSASHVLAHERAHIARKDHWWKPFGYLLLTVYWFNPVLWLAYILLCRDIELACDEKVIRDMEIPQKKAYSEALLSCSVNRRYVAACPLAFGEVGVKERVKTVLNYKKPAFWIVLVAILALIVTAVCFLTDPKTEDPEITEPAGESPYGWASTVKLEDFGRAYAKPYYGCTYTITLEGNALEELISLLNEIKEEEFVVRKPSGLDDPLWNYDGASVDFFRDGTPIIFRYADDTVIIQSETGSGIWETDGYWVIENEVLKQWMHSLSLGGTEMLSDENRAEIRQLLRMEQVQFFAPQRYDDLLFVGCAWDHGRGLGVAVYEPLADGYRLLKLIRGDEVKCCASGSALYYCDYQDMRIFLAMNESVTGMEFDGTYSASYPIDTHPGLVVEYFPEELNMMYRFNYGAGATTMYMDRNDRTHGKAPEYADDPFADPDDAYRICSNLRLNQVGLIWAQAILEPDAYHLQGFVTELSGEQMIEFLNLLRSIPETAYEQAQFPVEGAYSLEVFIFDVPTYPWLSLKRYEDAVYFQFHSDAQTVHQSWKIKSAELCGYIDHFFVGDISQWDRFAPYPKMEGEVSCKFGNVEIVVPKYAGFEYEVTDAGLRFKPIEESGWVLLQYLNAPYAPDDSALKLFSGIHFNYHSIRGCYEGTEVWTFMDITIPDEENEHHILLLNEDNASWVEAYDHDIGWLLDVREMEIRAIG